jgi:hypothetical protein
MRHTVFDALMLTGLGDDLARLALFNESTVQDLSDGAKAKNVPRGLIHKVSGRV